MTAAEPGRATYEVWRAAVPDVVCNVPGGPWEDLPATVQAGFNAIAAQSKPAPGLRADLEALAAFWVREYVTDDGWPQICAKQLLDVLGGTEAAPEPQPAPELEAAFANGMRVRTAPCTADAHDREHFQVRTNGHWLCGHLLASMLAAQGIVACTEAQPAPELAAAMAALATEMHAEADRIAPPDSDEPTLLANLMRAEVLHEYAARIRQLLGGAS